MMKRDDIIKNGILEQYILGELDDRKQLEVESILNSDSELRAYFNELEETFEKLGQENAIRPSEKIKTNLLKSIKDNSNNEKIISDNTSFNYKTLLTIAASIAALLLIGILWTYSELVNKQYELELVEEQKEIIEDNLKTAENKLKTTTKWLDQINSPNSRQYVLNGNKLSPNSKVISYVNDIDKSVVINTKKLAKLDSNQDYQMWADVKGEMIDMGVIDTSKELLAMTYIDNAESLNITIEPKGGNDHPTVSRLISNVYLEP